MKYIQNGKPTDGYTKCIKISMLITAPADQLFKSITNITHLSQFFPKFQFDTKIKNATLRKIGDTYRAKRKRSKKWTPYRVIAIEKNRRLSAKIISYNPIFLALRYDHRFIETTDGTISEETLEYIPRYSFLGKIMDFLFISRIAKRELSTAHHRLKKYHENKSRN